MKNESGVSGIGVSEYRSYGVCLSVCALVTWALHYDDYFVRLRMEKRLKFEIAAQTATQSLRLKVHRNDVWSEA